MSLTLAPNKSRADVPSDLYVDYQLRAAFLIDFFIIKAIYWVETFCVVN